MFHGIECFFFGVDLCCQLSLVFDLNGAIYIPTLFWLEATKEDENIWITKPEINLTKSKTK